MTDVKNPDKEDVKNPDNPKKPWLFPKGVSGNPKGRPKKGQWYLDQAKILRDNAPALIQKIMEMALDGDRDAMKLWAERIYPRLKPGDAPLAVDLPNLKESGNSSAELLAIGAEVINQRLDNNVDSSQAESVFEMINSQRSLIETESVQKQLDEIKEKLDN